MPTATAPAQTSLRRYLVAQGAYFAAAGLAGVIYPWLLTHELHASEGLVGLAQALGSVPTMLLVLAGGATADGRNLRGSGVGATMSRSMVQAAAPEAYRARVLSIFQFGQVWGGPPGAIVIGFCAQSFGVLNALLVPSIGAGLLWLSFRAFTRLWHFQRQDALSN